MVTEKGGGRSELNLRPPFLALSSQRPATKATSNGFHLPPHLPPRNSSCRAPSHRSRSLVWNLSPPRNDSRTSSLPPRPHTHLLLHLRRPQTRRPRPHLRILPNVQAPSRCLVGLWQRPVPRFWSSLGRTPRTMALSSRSGGTITRGRTCLCMEVRFWWIDPYSSVDHQP